MILSLLFIGMTPPGMQPMTTMPNNMNNMVMPGSMQTNMQWGQSAPVSPAPASEFDAICGSILNQSPNPSASATPTVTPQTSQKLFICKAAQSDKTLMEAKGFLWPIWSSVAGVCAGMCAASFFGISASWSQYICASASAGAAITDAVKTKEYANIMTGIMSIGGGLAANYMMKPSTSTQAPAASNTSNKGPKDVGACIMAAFAAFEAFTDHKAMEDTRRLLEVNLGNAKAIQAVPQTLTASPAPSNTARIFAPQPMNVGSGGPASVPATSSNLVNNSSLEGITPTLGTLASTGMSNCMGQNSSLDGQISCARSLDPKLPPGIATREFAQQFQNQAGLPLGDFLKGASTPQTALQLSMGAQATPAAREQLGQMLSESAKMSYISGRSLASNKGAKGSSGDEFLNQFLQQMGQKPVQTETTAQTASISGAPSATLAVLTEISDNPKEDVFKRLHARYEALSGRML